MAANMAAETQVALYLDNKFTYNVDIVSKHRFLGSSYLFWPTDVFWNDPVMQKSKMAASRYYEVYPNSSLLSPIALRKQIRCHFFTNSGV